MYNIEYWEYFKKTKLKKISRDFWKLSPEIQFTPVHGQFIFGYLPTYVLSSNSIKIYHLCNQDNRGVSHFLITPSETWNSILRKYIALSRTSS